MTDRDEGRTEWLRERLRMFTDRLASCTGPEEYTAALTNEVEAIQEHFRAEPSGDVGEGPYPNCTDCERAMVWDDPRREVPTWMCPRCVHVRMLDAERALARLRRTPETGCPTCGSAKPMSATQDPNAGGEDE